MPRLGLLLLAAGLALGVNLGGYRLLDPDEGRNAEVAREMAASNDYLLPHLEGLPYLDKPVVYFAAAALAMEMLGPTETAARLPAYLFTLATIALVVAFARRRWGNDAGWFAGIALATMPLVMAYARATIFDSTLAFCTTAAILAFWDERPVLAWAAMGLGALTKGPVALLVPLATVVPHALLTGGGRPLRRLFPLLGLGAFALVALPWFLAVSARIPEFPHYVFVRETLERVTTTKFHRTAPVWYYLPIVPVAAFPWIVPALARLKHWRWAWLAREANPSARDALLLVCWVLGPLAFFTFNKSKLPQYVLPLMPAFALAAARLIAREGIRVAWRTYAALAGLLGVALASLTVWFPAPIALTPAEREAIPITALALGIALLVSAALVWRAARRSQPILGATGYAVVVMTMVLSSQTLLAAVGDDRSAATLAQVIRNTQGTGIKVLGVAAFPPSLPFYLGETVDVATATGRELTSNFIADYVASFRASPGSPLKAADYWREVLARCPQPTVFVTSTGDATTRAVLDSTLTLLAVQGRYAAYGPCAASSAR